MEFTPLIADDSPQEEDAESNVDLETGLNERQNIDPCWPSVSTHPRRMAGIGVLALFVVVLVVAVASIAVFGNTSPAVNYEREKDPTYWHQLANQELDQVLHMAYQRGVAKNVVFFLGDGMGLTSVTAGRILAGQVKGLKGEEHKLTFDTFPHTGLSRTYNVDAQVTDSAASGTAYMTGVKTGQGMIGVSAKAKRGHCQSSQGAEVDSVLKWFADQGRSTGVVTTTRVTHATPASTYAHTPERHWEVDSLIPEDQRACEDIASQLVTKNTHINVVMGGGRSLFKSTSHVQPHPYDVTPYTRLDGRDLTQVWVEEKARRGVSHAYVTTREELNDVDTASTGYLLGLFNDNHMEFEVDREKLVEPSLAEMTSKAIEVLQANDQGYFLMVEGGRIDHGHHQNKAVKALHDVVSFSDAVQAAVRMTNVSDTLIVVTADHSHTMSIAGTPGRGNPILGKSKWPGEVFLHQALDNKPYATVQYANGPGFHSPRQDITRIDTENKEYISHTGIPTEIETHSGEDVAIYAMGPQAHLYSGVHEQNYIPILMAYASCVGPFADGKKACAGKTDVKANQQ